MKVEVLATGNIEKILNEENVKFSCTYRGEKYKVLEMEKSDAKNISNREFENAWCKFSNGAGGSPCYIVDVNGVSLIGWMAPEDSYEKLTDYLSAIGARSNRDICDYAVGLSNANGMTLRNLFKFCER